MDLNDVVSNSTVIGMAVTIVSFIVYVFAPNPLFIAIFVVGIFLMVVGYTYVHYQNRMADKQIEEMTEEVDRRGYILSLDDSYIPYQDEATIETLE